MNTKTGYIECDFCSSKVGTRKLAEKDGWFYIINYSGNLLDTCPECSLKIAGILVVLNIPIKVVSDKVIEVLPLELGDE